MPLETIFPFKRTYVYAPKDVRIEQRVWLLLKNTDELERLSAIQRSTGLFFERYRDVPRPPVSTPSFTLLDDIHAS